MRVPFAWLSEKFTRPPERSRIATALFESGFELEAEHWVRPGLETVVTGRILTCEMHPNADRLRICAVDVATSETLQIVTAAPNVRAGDIVPVALVGSTLPTGKEIGLGKLRGVESKGMFCSAAELGMTLDNPVDGEILERMEIRKAADRGLVLDLEGRAKAKVDAFENVLVLPGDTPLGREIAAVLELGDCVLEIAITANRGDGLSVTGLARALAAAGLGELAPGTAEGAAEGANPAIADVPGTAPGKIQVHLEAPDLCLRYAARIVTGVTVGPSPEWLARRLALSGIRSVNNVVDATNYVMLDVGQPLHAFDLAKIQPTTLVIRPSRLLESLVTLDGVTRNLPEGTLVVADASGPLAIAGVMGGADSAVSEATTALLLESAYFKPGAVRLAARRLGLSSESSYRFERGVDPEATTSALARAASLISGGAPFPAVEDSSLDVRRPGFPEPIVVPLRPERTCQILGCEIAADRQAQLLGRLGFVEITGRADHAQPVSDFLDEAEKAPFGSRDRYHDARWFRVPGWRRHDVLREIDLVEEIAQQHGYGAIPETLPGLDRLPSAEVSVVDRLRQLLRGFGFWEVLTSSLAGRHDQEGFISPGSNLVALSNPMGDLQAMRASLLPGLLEVARTNLNRGAERILIYDSGRVYSQSVDGRNESVMVGALAVGGVEEGLWKRPPTAFEADFFWAKGVAQSTLEALGLGELEPTEDRQASGLHPGRAARFEIEGNALAVFGELHPLLVERYSLLERSRTAVVMFDPVAIARCLSDRAARPFVPFSRYPASDRDVALVVDEHRQSGAIVACARQAGSDLLERARIFDRYVGPQIPQGKVSLALSLRYRAADRTLTDAEVDAVHGRIINSLCDAFEATVRV